jgi:hypothetical protein
LVDMGEEAKPGWTGTYEHIVRSPSARALMSQVELSRPRWNNSEVRHMGDTGIAVAAAAAAAAAAAVAAATDEVGSPAELDMDMAEQEIGGHS